MDWLICKGVILVRCSGVLYYQEYVQLYVHAIIIPTVIIKQLMAICMVMNQAAGILWFSKEHKDQEDLLLLAASLNYEKCQGQQSRPKRL